MNEECTAHKHTQLLLAVPFIDNGDSYTAYTSILNTNSNQSKECIKQHFCINIMAIVCIVHRKLESAILGTIIVIIETDKNIHQV